LARRLAVRGPPPQPNGELPANESKENQGNLLGFPWIPLAESGLFNGLQRIQIKKTFFLAARVSGCASPHRIARGEIWFRSAESIQRIPIVAKILSPESIINLKMCLLSIF
jgi:hypothetical protein